MRIGLVLLCISALPVFGMAAGKSSLVTVSSLSSKAKREKSYQADTQKRSIYAKHISNRLNPRSKKETSNRRSINKSSTKDLGFLGNIAIGSVLGDGEDIGIDSPIVFPPNMYFLTCTFVGSGMGDLTVLYDHCSGTADNHCVIEVEIAPSSVGTKSITRSCPWVFYPTPNGEDPNPAPVYGNMVSDVSWNGVKVAPPPKCPMEQSGSIIRVEGRSLSEYIPLVGVNFGLYYSTEVANGYVSQYSGIDFVGFNGHL